MFDSYTSKISEIKHLAFLIAMKRHRTNSVLLKMPMYKFQNLFNICGRTAKNYLAQMEEKGWIRTDQEGNIHLKAFAAVIREFYEKTGLRLNHYNLLKLQSTNFNEIRIQLEELFVLDNIIKPQQYRAKKKLEQLRVLNKVLKFEKTVKGDQGSTAKKSAPAFMDSREMAIYKKLPNTSSSRAFMKKKLQKELHLEVRSSARHTSKKLGMSLNRASKTLSRGNYYKRDVKAMYFDATSHALFDHLRAIYPKAVVFHCHRKDVFKVCFGSVLEMNRDNENISFYMDGSWEIKNLPPMKSMFPKNDTFENTPKETGAHSPRPVRRVAPAGLQTFQGAL